jgi:AraC-like DNA-binding protein
VDISFAGTLHISRLLTGRNLRPKRVMYRYARIQDTREYERILHCRPVFGQDCNCIVFHLSDLKYPVLGYNQRLYVAFQQLLKEELIKNENGGYFHERVRQVILERYQVAFPTLDDIASLMHITPRTLQRKLQDENTRFKTLSDSIRQVIASNLLGNPTLSLTEIAFKLGYAGPSPFRKAFKQWTGQTPTEFRKGRQQTSGHN